MPVLRNDKNIDTNRTEFVSLYAPTTTWGNIVSMNLQYPGLRAYWPMNSIDENNNIYDMSGQGRVLNIKTTPPLETYIYVATTAGGIYFTDNFVNEAIQPTWEDVSAGLGALDCKEFHIDPFVPADRQYVLIESENTLYRRVNGGNWEAILTLAIAAAACGVATTTTKIGGFCLNLTVPGRVHATFGANAVNAVPHSYWAIHSDDYGDNWTADAEFFHHHNYTYALGSIRASGDTLFISAMGTPFGNSAWYSEDGGTTIENTATLLSTGLHETKLKWNPLDNLKKIYYWGNEHDDGLHSLEIGAFDVPNDHWDNTVVFLDNAIYPIRLDDMWFDPLDGLHQRAIDTIGKDVYVTTDAWTTHAALVETSPQTISFNPVDINGEIIVGLTLSHINHYHHCIGVMTDETDAVPVGIAGTNCDTAPFTDSIPDTSGEPCDCGIQAFIA